MLFLADAHPSVKDQRAKYERADEAREKQRNLDASDIDSAATKWRYQPIARAVAIQKK